MSDIFREIEEELRRDNLLKLWARYRWYIVGVVGVALLIAGGIVAWRDYQVSQRRAEAARYAGAQSLARTGKEADAAKLFAGLAQAGGGYGVLAVFEQAELMARSGDRNGAAQAYDRIAASSELDRELRDLATLLSVMQGLPDQDPKAAIDRLQPLLAQGMEFPDFEQSKSTLYSTTHVDYEISDVKVNEPLDDPLFPREFVAGTVVEDRRSKEVFQLTGLSPAVGSTLKRLVTQGTPSVPAGPAATRNWVWMVVLNFAVLALIVAMFVRNRRREERSAK